MRCVRKRPKTTSKTNKGRRSNGITNGGSRMTFMDFDKYFDQLIGKCRGMRDTKGKEYANSTDRFANFDRLADTLNLTRLQIAQVYLQKHLDSINHYIKTGTEGAEPIEGRFVDAITYLSLMAGMVNEDRTASRDTSIRYDPINYEKLK